MMTHCYTTLINKQIGVLAVKPPKTYRAIFDADILLRLEAEVAELEQIGVEA